jgi:hypothetical protein
MTSINLYIKKHTFSDQFTSKYFFNFLNLIELEDINNLHQSVLNFASKAADFKEKQLSVFHPIIGDSLRIYKKDELSYGFATVGFINDTVFTDVFVPLESRINAVEETKYLYQILNWSISTYKKITIECGEFDEQTQKYHDLDFTFDQIELMYNQSLETNYE